MFYLLKLLRNATNSHQASIIFPAEYSIEKSKEEGCRGSFVSFDFNPYWDFYEPRFYEIQFFTRDSILQYTNSCVAFCFEGSYPTVDTYDMLKVSFDRQMSENGFEFRTLGNQNFFVSGEPCIAGRCYIRQYRTFINNMMIDIWVLIVTDANVEDPQKWTRSPTEENIRNADMLFSLFSIDE